VEDFGVDIGNFYFRGGTAGRIGKSTHQALWPLFDANQINEALRCQQNATHWKVRYALIVARNAFHLCSTISKLNSKCFLTLRWIVCCISAKLEYGRI